MMKTFAAVLLLTSLLAARQDTSSCPMHDTKSKHQADVESHGETTMGFPHDKTTHHFRLAADGGALEVTVNDGKDADDLQAIPMHLKHITTMFADGNFSIPMFVHSQTPPGVTEMVYRPVC